MPCLFPTNVTLVGADVYKRQITGRPIVFYVPDLKEYESGRGLYVPVNTLPGIVSSDLDEVASSLDAICKNRKEYCDFYKPQLDEMNRWCTYNDDGLSTPVSYTHLLKKSIAALAPKYEPPIPITTRTSESP